MYCYVWSYVVRPERLEEFRLAYGRQGEWVRLFRRDPDYIRTELLQDRNDPARFLTIDYWESREACARFRQQHLTEFEAIDARCEQLTLEETQLGEYVARASGRQRRPPGRRQAAHKTV